MTMTALFLAAALATQQPVLRDAGAVNTLLASLRTADPSVCEMAGRTLTNQWSWGGDLSDEPMPEPMPTPMPVPMPMPFASGGLRIAGPNFGHRGAKALDANAVAVFRTALRDESRCVRRIAARMVAREQPSWAASEFAALIKDADAGVR